MSTKLYIYRFLLIFAVVCSSLLHADPMHDQYHITYAKNIYAPPPITDIINIPQNSHALTSKFSNQGKASFAEYYSMYFKAWHEVPDFDLSELHELFATRKQRFLENYQLVSTELYDQIENNANLNAVAAVNQKAIVVHYTNLRKFPTISNFFDDPSSPGEGYPFDYMQEDMLLVGEPLLISHYSNDGEFAYVQSSSGAPGFVLSQDIAAVDNKFVNAYQNDLVMLTKDTLGYISTDKTRAATIKLFTTSVLPLQSPGVVLIPIRNATGNVELVSVKLRANNYISKPLNFSKKNVTMMVNQLIDQPYGWGGNLSHMDCARLVRNYFAVFGIHMPLLTKDQKNQGSAINLTDMNNMQKRKIILESAIPYQSIIYMPGHIALYLGTYKSEPIMLHAKWGVKLFDAEGAEYRYIIGKSVITTFTPGKELTGFDSERSDLLNKISLVANFNLAQLN